jgi:hypothetical protein
MYKRCNQIITSIALPDDGGVVGVDSVDVDVVAVVVAEGGDDSGLPRASGWTVGGVGVAGVAGEGTAGILGLVGQLEDLLTDEVVSGVADTGIKDGVVAGVLGTAGALAVDAEETGPAEAAALIPVLIEAAVGLHDGIAGLGAAVVDLVVGAAAAASLDDVEAEVAEAGLLGVGVDLILAADDDDACAVDGGEAGTAAAGVVLGEVGLVLGAALANVLDDLQAGLALADAVNEYLVGAAGVDAVAPLRDGVEGVALGTDAALAVDAVVLT